MSSSESSPSPDDAPRSSDDSAAPEAQDSGATDESIDSEAETPTPDSTEAAPDDKPRRSGSSKMVLCPYCGHTQRQAKRCEHCGGKFGMLSRRATQISMGPWFIRDKSNPFRPGFSYQVLVQMIESGHIRPTTILRGPTTRQFWSIARNVPGVSYRLGYCHGCSRHVSPLDRKCPDCGVPFRSVKLRNELGLQFTSRKTAEAAQRALNRELRHASGDDDSLTPPTPSPVELTPPGETPEPPEIHDEIGDEAEAGNEPQGFGESIFDQRLAEPPSGDLISDVLGDELDDETVEPLALHEEDVTILSSPDSPEPSEPEQPPASVDLDDDLQEMPETATGTGANVQTHPIALPPRRPLDPRVWVLVGLNALVALGIVLYIVMRG